MTNKLSITSAVKEYQKVPKKALVADPWEIFWDYKCGVEKKGESIFSEKNISFTSMHLLIYLCCFGMARSKTGLAYTNLNSFTSTVLHIKEEIVKLNGITFEQLDESHRQIVNSCYEKISDELTKESAEKERISGSITMVTKILMACWGHTPAFDRFFEVTYKELREELGWKRGDDYFDCLLTLKKGYEEYWKNEIDALEAPYTKTIGGNNIPNARLIDMAFWIRGNESE